MAGRTSLDGKKIYDVAVIGGGAAGLAASCEAVSNGASVLVLEGGSIPGAKILASGNGRCNMFNTGDPKGKYPHGEELALSVIKREGPEQLTAFFKEMGLLTVTKAEGRVYPRSEEAKSVRDILTEYALGHGAVFKTASPVSSVKRDGNCFVIDVKGYLYYSKQVILATGSVASLSEKNIIPSGFLKDLGVTVRPARAALGALITDHPAAVKWAGARANASVVLYADDRIVYEERGQVQFTKGRVSGIPVFNCCSMVSDALAEGGKCRVVLDLLDGMSEEDIRSLTDGKISLDTVIPSRLVKALGCDAGSEKMTRMLRTLTLDIKGTAPFRECQVLSGGIPTDRVDHDTLSIKGMSGIYAAGEMLDVDGLCGGWNLLFAFASGRISGREAARQALYAG